MSRPEPIHYLWWLVSRASGILAMVLISLSVLMGLAMATKLLTAPGLKRLVARLHEHVALVALLAIALHGLALLGDQWLRPGWVGITVPFALSYRPQFTGLGILAGYLAVLIGPSFYLRRRIGVARWRKVHRATIVVWLLSAIHTIGAGTDGGTAWMRGIVIGTGVPIVYLLMLRVLPRRGRPPAGRPTGRPTGRLAEQQASDAAAHLRRPRPAHRVDRAASRWSAR